jgi:hypothetical protein
VKVRDIILGRICNSVGRKSSKHCNLYVQEGDGKMMDELQKYFLWVGGDCYKLAEVHI